MLSGGGSGSIFTSLHSHAYPIFRLPRHLGGQLGPSTRPNTSLQNIACGRRRSSWCFDRRKLKTTCVVGATAQSSSAYPTVLDITVPVSLSEIWHSLNDLDNGILIAFHKTLGSENFSIRHAVTAEAALRTSAAEDIYSSVTLVLTYTTPLHLAKMRAQNTETVHIIRDSSTSIKIWSTCSTAGVPLSNCFVNKLDWKIETLGDHQTHMRIAAHTDFIVPVIGVLRSQIDRESLKGIKESYQIFSKVLQRRWPGLPYSPSPVSPSTKSTVTVSNLSHPGAFSTPFQSTNDSFELSSSGSTAEEDADTKDGISGSLSGKTALINQSDDSSASPAVKTGNRTVADDAQETEDEEQNGGTVEDDEDDDIKVEIPYKTAYKKFNLGDPKIVRQTIDSTWPEWYDNRYWMVSSTGMRGARTTQVPCPTPDEAVGVIWALGAACTMQRVPMWRINIVKEALMKGLVECLRMAPPRHPSPRPFGFGGKKVLKASQSKNSKKTGANSSQVDGGKAEKNKNDDGSDSAEAEAGRDKSAQNSASQAVPVSPPVINPTSISGALFCLGWIGGDEYFEREMQGLCEKIPEAEFRRIIEVYNVVWALRAARHWTEHLPLLEAETVRLFSEKVTITSRQLRHAAYCAQGLVHLGHVPHDLFTVLEPHVIKHWDWRAVCSLAWAIAIANELDHPLTLELLHGMKLNAKDYSAGTMHNRVNLSKIWQLLITIERLRHHLLGAKKDWNPELKQLIQAAEAEWKGLLGVENKQTSGAQREVYKTLESLGYAAEIESYAGGLSVDVVAQNEKIVVEVDGVWHFARNRPDFVIGNDLWKRRLLEAQGWTVVNVNVTVWQRQRGAGQRREFLRKLLDKEAEKKMRRDAEKMKRKKQLRREYFRRRGNGARRRYAAQQESKEK